MNIQHLADLASLTLGEAEARDLEIDLQKIVAHVDELQAIDVEGVPPTTSLGSNASLRSDVVVVGLSHADALAGAPQVAGEGFAVPTFVNE